MDGRNLRRFLAGPWTIQRTLRDLTAGASGTFTGTATFTENDDGGLLHSERGTLLWAGGTPVAASRVLNWHPGPNATSMEIYFSDGRFFHSLDLTAGTDHPTHPCAPDFYQGTFVIEGCDNWTYSWQITGPHKNLLLTTHLTRR